MSRTDLPPVPPAGRPRANAGQPAAETGRTDPTAPNPMAKAGKSTERNLKAQGRQGNIAQNTTHSGHQQDR